MFDNPLKRINLLTVGLHVKPFLFSCIFVIPNSPIKIKSVNRLVFFKFEIDNHDMKHETSESTIKISKTFIPEVYRISGFFFACHTIRENGENVNHF